MVEVAGIEPASIGVNRVLLRAQPQLRVVGLPVARGLAGNTAQVTFLIPSHASDLREK